MRALTLDHQGTAAFPEPIGIDFWSLPEAAIAVCGDVGSGKTTLLDLIPASLYLTMPYRPGPLHEVFSTNGYIRSTWAHGGKMYLSIVTVDVDLGKTEALLYESPDWTNPIAGPLQKSYLTKTREIMGDLSAYLIVSYALQPSAATTRKPSSFLSIPRAERREFMADMLGLNKYETYKDIADDFLALEKRALERLELLCAEQKKVADGRLDLETDVESARQQARSSDSAFEWAQSAAEAVQQRLVATAGTAEILARIEKDEKELVDRRNDVQIRYTTIAGEMESVDSLISQREEITQAEEALSACSRELTSVSERISVAQEAKTEAAKAENKAQANKSKLDDMALVTQVPCGATGPYAECPFLVRASLDRTRHEELVNELEDLRATVASMKDVASGAASLKQVKKVLEQRVETLRPVAEMRSKLDVAVALQKEVLTRRERLVQEAGDLDAKLDVLRRERETLEQQIDPSLRTEAEDAGKRLAEANRLVVSAKQELAVLEERYTRALDAEASVESLSKLKVKHERKIWLLSLIAQAMGPTGIPALKTELALPVVSFYATTLLRECMGQGRWEIQVIGQKPSADQKRALETLEVVIMRDGKEVKAERLSGGESVLISEALASAIGKYRSERDAGEAGLVMRDEISSSLGPMAGNYVDMLRGIVRHGGATQVLFATHDADAKIRADARLMVGNGKVTVA